MNTSVLQSDDEQLLDNLWNLMCSKMSLRKVEDVDMDKALSNANEFNEAGNGEGDAFDLFNVERILHGINTELQCGYKNPECHI